MAVFRIFFFLLIFAAHAVGEDFPFIPSGKTGAFIRFESNDTVFDEKAAYLREEDILYYKEPINSVKDVYLLAIYDQRKNEKEIANAYSGGYTDTYERAHPASTQFFFVRTAAGYYSVSINPGVFGAAAGGIAAGLFVGYDRFSDTGNIDLGTSARAASLMAGSSYVGGNVGSYASEMLFKPALSEGVMQGAMSSATGGVATGVLFAAGAFATGYADRHEMRTIAAKSAVGSSASAGVNAVLGVGTASVSGLIFPYIAAAGAVYAVEKMFTAFDKQEEKEKVDRLLIKLSR